MGEQQIQPGAGVRVEVGTDQGTNSSERGGSIGQQPSSGVNGTTLKWKRPSPNSKFIRELETLVKIVGYAIRKDVKQIHKQIESLEKNR